jgi:hypothetical protein
MQTYMRFSAKTLSSATQALVEQYLRNKQITVITTAQRNNTQHSLRSKHIGKNCKTRCNARV